MDARCSPRAAPSGRAPQALALKLSAFELQAAPLESFCVNLSVPLADFAFVKLPLSVVVVVVVKPASGRLKRAPAAGLGLVVHARLEAAPAEASERRVGEAREALAAVRDGERDGRFEAVDAG